jgi:hypothetical protein
MGRMEKVSVLEQGAEENIRTNDGGNNKRLEKTYMMSNP